MAGPRARIRRAVGPAGVAGSHPVEPCLFASGSRCPRSTSASRFSTSPTLPQGSMSRRNGISAREYVPTLESEERRPLPFFLMTAPRHGFNTTAITHGHKQHWIADTQVMHIGEYLLVTQRFRGSLLSAPRSTIPACFFAARKGADSVRD